MLTFNYTAHDTATNKTVKSTVQAESERSAAKLLMEQGLTPLNIKEQVDSGGIFSYFANRVGSKDRVIFTRQLATLINAGLPLAQALHSVQEQTGNKRLHSIVSEIIIMVESGNTLSDAFSKHKEVFNDVYISLIAAGEISGTLDTSLERIADQQEKDADMISKVRGALVYPAIVLVVIIGVIIFMMVAVVPQIKQLYADLNGRSLPFITQVMVVMADFIINYWWIVLIVLAAGIFFARRYIQTTGGRLMLDTVKLHVPLFGVMFQKLYMARFTRTAQTLMEAGVPMLQVLQISQDAINNVVISKAIGRSAEKVKGGKALSDSLKPEPEILSLVPQMIKIGEQSGGVDKMMDKAATFYEKELENTIRSLSSAIEPVLMVAMAVVAGGMVAAILLPVYSLVQGGVSL